MRNRFSPGVHSFAQILPLLSIFSAVACNTDAPEGVATGTAPKLPENCSEVTRTDLDRSIRFLNRSKSPFSGKTKVIGFISGDENEYDLSNVK